MDIVLCPTRRSLSCSSCTAYLLESYGRQHREAIGGEPSNDSTFIFLGDLQNIGFACDGQVPHQGPQCLISLTLTVPIWGSRTKLVKAPRCKPFTLFVHHPPKHRPHCLLQQIPPIRHHLVVSIGQGTTSPSVSCQSMVPYCTCIHASWHTIFHKARIPARP